MLVQKASGSVGFLREIEGVPVVMGKSIDGGTKETTVRKCKNCKEILGTKDYIKSVAELEAEKKQNSHKAATKGGAGCLGVLTCTGLVILGGVLLVLLR